MWIVIWIITLSSTRNVLKATHNSLTVGQHVSLCLTKQDLVSSVQTLMENNEKLEKEVKGLLSINKGLECELKAIQKMQLDFQSQIVHGSLMAH